MRFLPSFIGGVAGLVLTFVVLGADVATILGTVGTFSLGFGAAVLVANTEEK